MKRKYALVLSGGGFKGAFQVGALKHLEQNWHLLDPSGAPMHFDIVAGISVGSLNGGMVAMNKMAEMEELWKQVAQNGVEEIYTSPFIDTKAKGDKPKFDFNIEALIRHFLPDFELKANIWDGISMLLSKKARQRFLQKVMAEAAQQLKASTKNFKSLADNSPLQEKLKKHFDKDQIKDCEFLCGLVDLDKGLYSGVSHHDFLTNDDFINGVLASTVMPIVWEPVQLIRTNQRIIRNSVDGGIRNNSPLADVIEAIDRRATADTEYVLVVINCNNGEIVEENFDQANVMQIALRSMTEITLSEIFNNDLELFLRVNDLVKQAGNSGLQLTKESNIDNMRIVKPLRAFRSIVIQPEGSILGDMLVANETLIKTRLDHGIEKASEALQNFIAEEEQAEAA
ncbi:MAG TPA: patatin-like phospholipase family protein [Saprospiraceae bacterium]|nr:patatin-like phospholipase family protein [Saprospiraceae bacterium]HMQ83575.1 patatin-like phospholipase family protein [Saprospiraceae bacterium]